jgi:uncharacterized protein
MKIEEVKEPIEFEWDEGNSNKNWNKHGVTQREAEQAFFDEDKFLANDVTHSKAEKRFVLLGKAETGRLLYVVYTIREKRVRIISARNISKKKEVDIYEETTRSAKVQK